MAFGVYVHVPWCASVCGYCDFNTYVPGHLDGTTPAVMRAELGPRRPQTVFFGGGTPTLLAPADLIRILQALDPAPGAEISVEANPETVDEAGLAALREAGFTRVSIGMQSARAHVLRTLERAHTPGAAIAAMRAARAAGFDHVGADLIYGTPGETEDDWRASLDAALSGNPDHVAAYALTVEPGTKLAAHVRAGRVPEPDEDALARRYELADATLTAAGLPWYEVSNWARTPNARCHPRGLRPLTDAQRSQPPVTTGAEATGGRSGRERTGTWTARASGRTATRRCTRATARAASCRSPAARRLTPVSGSWSGSCSASAPARA